MIPAPQVYVRNVLLDGDAEVAITATGSNVIRLCGRDQNLRRTVVEYAPPAEIDAKNFAKPSAKANRSKSQGE